MSSCVAAEKEITSSSCEDSLATKPRKYPHNHLLREIRKLRNLGLLRSTSILSNGQYAGDFAIEYVRFRFIDYHAPSKRKKKSN